jgi:enoyl-CoA hydratase/carnithine racemase
VPAELKSSSQGHTLVLTISNPEHRNAGSPEVYAAGVEALSVAETSPDVRAIIITGEGSTFCAGGQLQRLQANRQLAPSVQAEALESLHAWVEAIRTCPKPVIAAVEGAAAGAGFSLALACDFLVAAENAVFVMAYATVGISPDAGGSWSLGRALPRALASELLMMGERIDAPRLQALGVANRVTPPGQALGEALALAERLQTKAPNALASIKELLNEATVSDLHSHLTRERDHFVRNLHHRNAGIAIDAFLNKQTARFE